MGDRNPRCRFCPVEMIPESDYSQLWMSPYIAIKRMQTISEKYGIECARTDGRFKKEREAWTTAVFSLVLSKLNGERWWVEIETKENTPDTRLRRVEQSSGNNEYHLVCAKLKGKIVALDAVGAMGQDVARFWS